MFENDTSFHFSGLKILTALSKTIYLIYEKEIFLLFNWSLYALYHKSKFHFTPNYLLANVSSFISFFYINLCNVKMRKHFLDF